MTTYIRFYILGGDEGEESSNNESHSKEEKKGKPGERKYVAVGYAWGISTRENIYEGNW